MSKKIIALVVVVFVLAGVGGWFLHSSMVEKDYEAAWKSYGKEVQAWQDVNERYQVLEPVCSELAGEAECGELKTVGEQAGKATEKLSLDLKKAKSASKEETQKLEKATKAIKTERKKFEPAVVKVEKVAEATIQDKFAPVLGEAEKKAGEASGLVGSLKGKVKDENTLKTLESAASELSSVCGKWKGKDIPTGQEGVQAYLELKRLTLTCSDAVTKANESHAQWQKEEDERKAKEQKTVDISGTATLSGTIYKDNDSDIWCAYMLKLDTPVTFHGKFYYDEDWEMHDPPIWLSMTLSEIQIQEGATLESGGFCGIVEPWESHLGQHVSVRGEFRGAGSPTGHWHSFVAFKNETLLQ